jgi:hypothetical protein
MFKQGELIADFIAAGVIAADKPPPKHIVEMDKLLPQLTEEELRKVFHELDMLLLMDPETPPDLRREILARFERCPCCERWLGHNRPPADDGEPAQAAFEFEEPR